MIIKNWLNNAINLLRQSDSAKTDALLMLSAVLDKSSAWIYAFDDAELTKDQLDPLNELLKKRLNGEPMAYILGYKSFWKHNFKVTKDTLIPRADTEILIETALHHLKDDNYQMLDLGTGSGAIAISLAFEKPNSHITAVDNSEPALCIAKENAKANKINNITFKLSNWFDALEKRQFDVIVSNPPYIDPIDPHLNIGDLRFEPITALISQDNGLNDIKLIIKNAANHLKNSGLLLIEHGYDQGKSVREIFKHYDFNDIETIKDYGGNERVTLGFINK